MHLGLFFVGLLSGGTAAIAAFGAGAGLWAAVLAYALCSLGAVLFAAVIWAMAPQSRPAPAAFRRTPPS
jgi:hypothetical protein